MTRLIAAVAVAAALAAPVRAADPGPIARLIGLEMLRIEMVEQNRLHQLEIDWTPPGYFMVGYPVRVG